MTTTAAVPYQPPNSKGCVDDHRVTLKERREKSQRMAGKEGAKEAANTSTSAAAAAATIASPAGDSSASGEPSTKKVAVPPAAPKRTTSQEVSDEVSPVDLVPPPLRYGALPRVVYSAAGSGKVPRRFRFSLPKKRQSSRLGLASRLNAPCLLPYVVDSIIAGLWSEGDA